MLYRSIIASATETHFHVCRFVLFVLFTYTKFRSVSFASNADMLLNIFKANQKTKKQKPNQNKTKKTNKKNKTKQKQTNKQTNKKP